MGVATRRGSEAAELELARTTVHEKFPRQPRTAGCGRELRFSPVADTCPWELSALGANDTTGHFRSVTIGLQSGQPPGRPVLIDHKRDRAPPG